MNKNNIFAMICLFTVILVIIWCASAIINESRISTCNEFKRVQYEEKQAPNYCYEEEK